jgi:hypothetical protein
MGFVNKILNLVILFIVDVLFKKFLEGAVDL